MGKIPSFTKVKKFVHSELKKRGYDIKSKEYDIDIQDYSDIDGYDVNGKKYHIKNIPYDSWGGGYINLEGWYKKLVNGTHPDVLSINIYLCEETLVLGKYLEWDKIDMVADMTIDNFTEKVNTIK
jgi:hypothetical protein